MDIIEGNKLITEFLGLKYGWWVSQDKPLTEDKKQWCDLDGNTFLETKVYYNKDLKFHSSWDWLIPVVEKIENDYWTICTTRKLETSFAIHEAHNRFVLIARGNSKSKIEAVWKAVVEFIKWYNLIKPK